MSQSQQSPPAGGSKPPKPQNPALRMLGLPALPKKLPSRNWLIFWAITGTFTTAIIYDKREKNRATAKWRRAVAPLASEPIGAANQLPRKLTIYLESPPGDGLRVAQDHFIEYAKPVLAASGLDWEFVQGRQQGDVRAAVAEKIRRGRRAVERPNEEVPKTDETIVEDLQKRLNLPQHVGVKGDIVVGRHAWKEYMRGLHEGWLGPLDPPPLPVAEPIPTETASSESTGTDTETEGQDKKLEEKKKPTTPERPPQPPPYNAVEDYASSVIPTQTPSEFNPSMTIPFPHRLGFSSTFVRLGWFLNRRKLADEVGRNIAAVCFAASREYREADGTYEQQVLLEQEERNWIKSVWKDEPDDDEKDTAAATGGSNASAEGTPLAALTPKKEKIWISDLKVDPRIVQRMRRFEITPEEEAKAQQIRVPEEEIEGWIKGSLRSLWRWGASSFAPGPQGPNVGNLDD